MAQPYHCPVYREHACVAAAAAITAIRRVNSWMAADEAAARSTCGHIMYTAVRRRLIITRENISMHDCNQLCFLINQRRATNGS